MEAIYQKRKNGDWTLYIKNYYFFQDLLDYEEDDVEEVFCLNFSINESAFGEVVTKPLKPGRAAIQIQGIKNKQSTMVRRGMGEKNEDFFRRKLRRKVMFVKG